MFKLVKKLCNVKRRSLIFDEVDLNKVFNAIGNHQNSPFVCNQNIDVCKAGCGNYIKWLVAFDASEKVWLRIVNELKVIRVWQITDIPMNCDGKVYSTD